MNTDLNNNTEDSLLNLSTTQVQQKPNWHSNSELLLATPNPSHHRSPTTSYPGCDLPIIHVLKECNPQIDVIQSNMPGMSCNT